mgnify:FL=1|jgi:hypothetical protein
MFTFWRIGELRFLLDRLLMSDPVFPSYLFLENVYVIVQSFLYPDKK